MKCNYLPILPLLDSFLCSYKGFFFWIQGHTFDFFGDTLYVISTIFLVGFDVLVEISFGPSCKSLNKTEIIHLVHKLNWSTIIGSHWQISKSSNQLIY